MQNIVGTIPHVLTPSGTPGLSVQAQCGIWPLAIECLMPITESPGFGIFFNRLPFIPSNILNSDLKIAIFKPLKKVKGYLNSDGMQHLLNWQRYTYRVLQTIQIKLIRLCVWAEPAVLGSTKIALKFKLKFK